jgi:hypothetical protein
MKKYRIVLLALAIWPSVFVASQNTAVSNPKDVKIQTISIQNDTVLNLGMDKKLQITIPETPTVYSIASYKNVDFLKTNPLQLEAAGLHPEIYISNTHHGVIIISSAESNDALKDFTRTLELNPNYYETLSRQDTTIFTSGNNKNTVFDFTKASSINHDYKNAFNYTLDSRTGVSWSKGTHKDFLENDILGKAVYDLIIVRPKK